MAEEFNKQIASILKTLTLEMSDWQKQKVDPNMLIEISSEEKVWGPISKLQLKAILGHYPDIDFKMCKIRPYSELFANSQFEDLYSNNYFQRRSPKLVQEEKSPSEEQYWLLVDGQKNGPFASDQLQAELDRQNIFYTDLISFDNAQNWCKVHEYQGLDRRTRPLPAKGIERANLVKSEAEATRSIQPNEEEQSNQEMNALVAFIGENNKKNIVKLASANQSSTKILVSEINTENLNNSSSSFAPFLLLPVFKKHLKKITATIIAILLLLIAINKKNDRRKEEVGTLSPSVEDTDNPSRHFPRPSSKQRSIASQNEMTKSEEYEDVKPQRSFKRSRPFKSVTPDEETQNEGERSPSEVNGNNNSADEPVEQDEIREKLSKETIDPTPPDEESPVPELPQDD